MEEIKTKQDRDKQNNNKQVKKTMKHILFFIIWLGIIIKLFAFDWDVYILDKFLPEYRFILNYKLLFLALIIILTSRIKISSIIGNILFFAFYPAILLIYYIPSKLFSIGKINAIIAYINSLMILFKNIRIKTFISICCIFGIVFITSSSNNVIICISVIFFSSIIILLIISMFKIIFSNENLFAVYKKIIAFFQNKNFIDNSDLKEIHNIEDLKNKKTLLNKVESTIIMNRLSLLISKKYKEYNDSKFYIFQEILVFITIVIIGVFSLSLINYGIYRINPTNFTVLNDTSLIDFIIYSIFQSNGNIVSATILTKTILILSSLLYLIYTSVLFVLIVNRNKDKQKKEINNMIECFESLAKKEENKLAETNLFENIDKAIEGLKMIESSCIGFIDLITKYL